ncbi:hypothetical protein [Nocardia vermiculata]|uniref:Ig-like domain-containing protein n=1 Tax=Nocardia vermiculata TaxID=257274 RepID=A0A846XVM8_9NOCA|nr:hypothetical protein [Nocardia vermiculata]NKY50052.1 hypothetical protein [Nocardia vermiculata]
MTGSNPPNGGSEHQGPGNPPNETVHWWSTAPQVPEQPLTGTDPTVMGGQPGPVTGTDPTVLGAGFDAYHHGMQQQQPYGQQQQYGQQQPYGGQPPSQPSYPQQQFPPPYGQQPPYPPPPGKKSNTGLIVAGVVGLVVVIGAVVSVIALTGGDSGGDTKKKDNGVDGNYSMEHVTNACNLIDPTVLQQWAPNVDGVPEHTERAPGKSIGGGSLTCRASYDGAGKYGTDGSDIDLDVDFKSKYGDPRYQSWKQSDTQTTGTGRTSGPIPGIGTEAYYAINQRDYSSFTTLDYTCAAIDSNVSVKVELDIQAEGSINTDTVATTCKNQLQKALSGLKK